MDCKENDVIPNFLGFNLAKTHFKNTHVYKKCQIRLLEQKIQSTQKRINSLEKGEQSVKEELQGTLYFTFFLHLFVVSSP